MTTWQRRLSSFIAPDSLRSAVGDADLDRVTALVSGGADVNEGQQDGETETALHIAATSGSASIVELLIEAGASLDVTTRGLTALELAVYGGHTAVVEALTRAGADPNACDESGPAPLFFAVLQGELAVVRALLRAGARVNASIPDGTTPLHAAVCRGDPSILTLLLQAGADCQALNADHQTPYDLAGHRRLSHLLHLFPTHPQPNFFPESRSALTA